MISAGDSKIIEKMRRLAHSRAVGHPGSVIWININIVMPYKELK